MTFCASIPVASIATANAALAEDGFGPNNFSVPTRTAWSTGDATHASLSHAGIDPAFQAAVEALPGVLLDETRFPEHIAAQTLEWPDPTKWYQNPIMIGDQRAFNSKTWESLVDYNVWTPPVNWREVVVSGFPAWVQPTGAQDAYPLGFKVTHNGQNWENTGSAANVWEPGVFGWVVIP